MLKNYLKIALRNIRRNKLYSMLNILGLSIGLGSFFIIYLFLQNELSYDQFHSQRDNIFRVVQGDKDVLSNGQLAVGLTPALGPALGEEVPEILAFSRLENWNKNILIPGIADSTDNVQSAAVDPGFLKFFDLDIVAGSKEGALQNPTNLLLNETKAIRYFGSAVAAIGQFVKVGRSESLKVVEVFKDLANTTSIKAEVVVMAIRLKLEKREP